MGVIIVCVVRVLEMMECHSLGSGLDLRSVQGSGLQEMTLLPGESVPTSLLFKNWLFYLFGELKFLTVQFCFKLF